MFRIHQSFTPLVHSWWAKHDGHPSGFCHRVLFLMILLTEAANLLLQTRARHSVTMFTHNHRQFVLFGELMSKKRTFALQASFSRIVPPTSAVIGYTIGFPKLLDGSMFVTGNLNYINHRLPQTVGWQYVCRRTLVSTIGFPKTVRWQYVCRRKLELYQP